jgi:UDP-2,3-diacylglucosamine pyrophosphatase LpxH
MSQAKRTMVAVISDLHFEEEASDRIEGIDGGPPVEFIRNIPAAAFEDMIGDVVDLAKSKQITDLHFVLAGDIFDLHRTQMWFSCQSDSHALHPYVDNDTVAPNSPLEALVLRILDAIAAEPRVKESLAVFRRFTDGCFIDEQGQECKLVELGMVPTLHFLPGNHDRLVNATPAIRQHTRQLLGLAQTPAPFPHQIEFKNPALLVRHGHEYDRYNFAHDYRRGQIPAVVPEAFYGHATFGDFITVNIASRLPYLFCRHHGRDKIPLDPIKRAAYIRLLQFDDVRPQTALLDFFLSAPTPAALVGSYGSEEWQKKAWDLLESVMIELADEVVRDAAFLRLARRVFPLPLLALLLLRPWRFGIPAGPTRWIVGKLRSEPDDAQLSAAREAALHKETYFISAGHTHQPQVALLPGNRDMRRSYFVDTGTWRNAILPAAGNTAFGRLNAMTYVAFYGDHDTSPLTVSERRNFAYHTGFEQQWPVDEYDV